VSVVNKGQKGFVDSNGNHITMSDGSSGTSFKMNSNGTLNVDTGESAGFHKPKRTQEIDYYIKVMERKVEHAKKDISIFEKTLEKLNSYCFKEGDVVISKSHGTGIVTGIGVGDGMPSVINEAFPDQFYVVIATKDGYMKVPPEDIMPYTMASKILHERG